MTQEYATLWPSSAPPHCCPTKCCRAWHKCWPTFVSRVSTALVRPWMPNVSYAWHGNNVHNLWFYITVHSWSTLYAKERMYYRSGTGVHCCIGAQPSCSLTRWQHVSTWNDIMVAILIARCQIQNPTPSIDTYLLEEHSRQISSQSDLKPQSLRLFWWELSQEEEQQQDE